MWLLYQDTGEERYAGIARVSERKMEKCFADYYGLHHDVGFMFQLTAVADYRLTGNPDARRIGLHAANLLAGRFNPAGKFIRAWNDGKDCDTRGWAIIDCMFNISLLYWTSEESGDPRFRQIAMMHADTVRKNFIRSDGSVCHIVEFNPETGEKIKSYGGQGYADGSAWSRGQGWAQYCIANLPDNGIIPVDFRQPPEPTWEDSCGACIIAGGLLEIARYVSETEREIYTQAAMKILKVIAKDRADWSEN